LAEGGAAPVKGDPVMMAALVRNLVDNAVRYTQTGGEVVVKVEAEPRQVRLSVADNGPGIPAEERSKVGQRFYRVLGSGEAGSGLGLSIAARICELHGAVMSLAEGANGKGLCASVTLPPPAGDHRS
jgi:two-component system sensor histidine kinase QseC